jgi:branched-chain amino acid transport system permease protein
MAATLLAVGAALSMGLSDADALRASKAVAVGIVALSLVPLVGWAGQLCLCQMSFAALGAICVGHFGGGSNPWALLVGMAVAGVVGVIVALPAARLSGIELALATAAFAVILDRWVFNTADVELGPFTLRTFNRDSLPVDRLSLPFLGSLSTTALLMTVVVAFTLVHLLLVAVRRSGFGDRLLALRESPAACATLGLDPAAARLAVFGFSASLAGLGGGLYAGTLGAVTPDVFNLFQSLPLLLTTVAGGVAGTGGAVFSTVTLGSIPIVAKTFTGIAGLLGLLPGTMGITLGRNPDGVVSDLRTRVGALWPAGPMFFVTAAIEVALVTGWLTGALSGWWVVVAGFLAPFVTGRIAEGRGEAGATVAREEVVDPLDDLDHRRLDPATIAAIDEALGLAEVPVVRA